MTTTIRIVAAVVDTRCLTLYKADGSTLTIPQGDTRLRKIVDAATPQLLSQGYADVDIAPADNNSYAAFEQQSGIVKFFRVAKQKLKELLAITESVDPEPKTLMTVGSVPDPAPGSDDQEEEFKPVPPANMSEKAVQTLAAVAEILQHAVPVTSPQFSEDTVARQGNVVEDTGETNKSTQEADAPDTIIAVVDNKVIPGVEKIKTQFARATKLGSTTGVDNFLKRLATVIEQRSHSVEDLLTFMERGDLPIAEDGSILIYKVLTRKGDRTDGRYVDCHTKKVEQWTGAYVCMDPSLVDHQRNNECSNGLHVARRGYIRNFSGDVCVLAKLAPEDVITVPSYDANKMRVCCYHILMELSDKQYSLLKQNRPITEDEEGQRLLAKALAGQHVRKTHEVRITGQLGQGVIVKAIPVSESPAPVLSAVPPEAAQALANPAEETRDTPTDPKEVVQKVEQQLSRKEQAAKLYAALQAGKEGALDALVAFKKSAKLGWAALGIPDPTDQATKPVPAKLSKKAKKRAKAPAVKQDTKCIVNGVQLGEGSFRDRIHKLLAIGLTSVGVAQAIIRIKQQSKKSWTTLGVSEAQVQQIMQLASK